MTYKLDPKVFAEIAKLSKEGYVVFFENRIILINYVDYMFNTAMTSIIELKKPLIEGLDTSLFLKKPAMFRTETINELKKASKDYNIGIGPEWLCIQSGDITRMSILEDRIKHFITSHYMGPDNLHDKFSKIHPNLSVDNLKENETFNGIINGKSADGGRLFPIGDKYDMFLYSNLLPINKPDKVSLNIYDLDEMSFLSKFIIEKKLVKVSIYFRFRYVRG